MIVFIAQTVDDLYSLYKGSKRSQDIAPGLIKRLAALFYSVAGIMAGSALAPLILIALGWIFPPLVAISPLVVFIVLCLCQSVGAITGHSLGYYLGSFLCGGRLEQSVKATLDWLKENILSYIFEFPVYVFEAANIGFKKVVNIVIQRGEAVVKVAKQAVNAVATTAKEVVSAFNVKAQNAVSFLLRNASAFQRHRVQLPCSS